MKTFKLLILFVILGCKQNSPISRPPADPCDQLTTITYSYIKDGVPVVLYNVIDIVIGPETNYYLGSDFISKRETTVTYLDTICCCIKYEIITNETNILTNEKIK